MNVAFYFDPSCPFCWITSRWLHSVSEQRDVTIDWQPFSLAIKNNEVDNDDEALSPYGESHRASHRVLRVIEAAVVAGADRGKLYTDFGKLKHVDGEEIDDMAIDITLGINSLSPDLASAADDPSYDAAIAATMNEALALTGKDVGVPIIVFTQADGNKAGFFGPVLQAMPDAETSLKLWDGLSALASVPEFYELKRARPDGMPDTGSTKGQFGPAVC